MLKNDKQSHLGLFSKHDSSFINTPDEALGIQLNNRFSVLSSDETDIEKQAREPWAFRLGHNAAHHNYKQMPQLSLG